MVNDKDNSPSSATRIRRQVLAYSWLVAKNVVGWVLILGAGPIGVALPGPGGLPLFLIGFALVTFPGKRNLTARVLRGIPVRRESRAFRITLATVAMLAPAGLISFLCREMVAAIRWQDPVDAADDHLPVLRDPDLDVGLPGIRSDQLAAEADREGPAARAAVAAGAGHRPAAAAAAAAPCGRGMRAPRRIARSWKSTSGTASA